ncbi:MAG: hypothetical protein D6737_03760 [Chloroflexi bacterium]|nr:MAG: hypothetical protein D6737_03760 [Chloroflexota bacterium]
MHKFILLAIGFVLLMTTASVGLDGGQDFDFVEGSSGTTPLSFQLNSEYVGQHPRLFFTWDEVPLLQEKMYDTHAAIWDRIYMEAEDQLAQPFPTQPPDDATFNFFRDEGTRLLSLAFACVLDESDRYCDPTVERLMTHASWPVWDQNDERGLGHAHMLLGNALAYDWVHVWLDDDERATIQESLRRQGQKLYEASTNAHRVWWHASYFQNHFTSLNSALGLAGMVLAGDVPARLCDITPAAANVNMRQGPGTNFEIADLLPFGETATAVLLVESRENDDNWWLLDNDLYVATRVVNLVDENCSPSAAPEVWAEQAAEQFAISQEFLNGIGDGSWHESIPYQDYMLSMSLPFLFNLRRLSGEDLFPHTYLQNYPDWRLYNLLNNGDFILSYGDFGKDWQTGFAPFAIVRFAANEYDDPIAAWTAERLAATATSGEKSSFAVFEFFYYDPTLQPEPPVDKPLSYVSEDLEAVIWRTGWDDDALVFGLKAGPLGGRFGFDTFVSEQAPWSPPCRETGCQLNIDHDHSDAGTFYLFRNNEWLVPEFVQWGQVDTPFHNTLLIDGESQYRPPPNHFHFFSEDFAGSDAFLRQVVDGTQFNYAVADLTGSYKQIDDLQEIARHVVFVRPDYFVMLDTIRADEPHYYQWLIHFEDSVAIEESWFRGQSAGGQLIGVDVAAAADNDMWTEDAALPRAVIAKPFDMTDARLATLLYPTTQDEWASRPVMTTQEDTGESILLRVTQNDGRFDDIIINYGQPEAPVQIGAYTTDADLAIVRHDQSGNIDSVYRSYNGCVLEAQSPTATSETCNAGLFEVTT